MKKPIISLAVIIGFLLSAGIVGAAALENPIGASDFKSLIIKIADAVGTIIAGASTIMFVIAGGLFLFSAGSPERINAAKKCLIYAVIGTVIALAAKGLATQLMNIIG